jgi:hypothetical protein
MLNILKKKQEECKSGVRTFRRVDPSGPGGPQGGKKKQANNNLGPLININQIG